MCTFQYPIHWILLTKVVKECTIYFGTFEYCIHWMLLTKVVEGYTFYFCTFQYPISWILLAKVVKECNVQFVHILVPHSLNSNSIDKNYQRMNNLVLHNLNTSCTEFYWQMLSKDIQIIFAHFSTLFIKFCWWMLHQCSFHWQWMRLHRQTDNLWNGFYTHCFIQPILCGHWID